MNTSQKLIPPAAALLLVLTFVFPYSSYPTKEQIDDRSFRSTVRGGFVPIWRVVDEQANATLPGNMFDHSIIQWPVVFGLAAAIVVGGVWCFRASASPPLPASEPQSTSPRSSP